MLHENTFYLFNNPLIIKKAGVYMKKAEIGIIAVIFGGLILSLEFYCLKIIQLMEMKSGLPWRNLSIDYIKEKTIAIAMLITLVIILYGVYLIINSKKSSTP